MKSKRKLFEDKGIAFYIDRRHYLRAFLIAGLVAIFAGSSLAATPVFIPIGKKGLYQFMPPFNIKKSREQMLSESQNARRRFSSVLDSVTEPVARRKDLLSFVSPVKDQGHRGSCSAFATVGLMELMVNESHQQKLDLSEQYLYWAAKSVLKIVPNAEGVEHVSQMLQAAVQVGTPAEQAWPYEKFGWFELPKIHLDCYNAFKANPDHFPSECITNGNPSPAAQSAPKIKLAAQQASETAPEAIVAFINKGFPVEIGISIFESAWKLKNPSASQFTTGKITMPEDGEMPEGGHAVTIVGYDLDSKVYLFKNSWGTDSWAANGTWNHDGNVVKTPGFGTIPMDYVRQYAEAAAGKLN